MLTINIICVGKLKEKFFKDAIDEYSKRLSKYCKLNIIELPDEKIPEKTNPNIENEIKTKECNNIINHIKKDSYVISLDLTGKQLSSEEFSKNIENISMQSSQITFIIGGSLGLTDKVLSMSNQMAKPIIDNKFLYITVGKIYVITLEGNYVGQQ